VVLIVGLLVGACSQPYPDVESYWDPMLHATDAEGNSDPADLTPRSCAECHPSQYDDWKDSRHAHAMAPGVMHQLLEHAGEDDASQEAVAFEGKCLTCHAPLSEQHPVQFYPSGDKLGIVPHERFHPDLSLTGVSCAVCHVRGGVIHGPGNADPESAPHPVRVREFFSSPAFCASCHEHPKATPFGPVGAEIYRTPTYASPDTPELKKHQSTYSDFLTSSAADRGLSCQSCHMPGGRHLFRGIHDRDMARTALAFDPRQQGDQVTLDITNLTGHTFPVYRPPKVLLTLSFETDCDISEGERSREFRIDWLNAGPDVTGMDLRLTVDEVRTYEVAIPPGASTVDMTMTVWPDEAYRSSHVEHLNEAMARGASPLKIQMIQTSISQSSGTSYRLWSARLPLNPPDTTCAS